MSDTKLICEHCGSICPDDSISLDSKYFCCNGCKMVYEILHENDLEGFYGIEDGKGAIKPDDYDHREFAFLDNSEIADKLKTYSINNKAKITFLLPQIHCSACIWLLEKLPELKEGILEAKVDFMQKEIDIVFNENDISVRQVVELLTALGYKPKMDLNSIDNKKQTNPNKALYIKLGIAGFCFGNLMMLAFPEYLSGGDFEFEIKEFIKWINLLFIIPLLYSGSDYLKSAYYGLKTKVFNIDIPISIGLLALAGRSIFEIISGFGAGYVDSLGGLVFFLLTGKLFQQKTFNTLSFNRDYRSYFPLSVIRKNNDNEEYIPLKDIKVGDLLFIRNNEIIPTDSLLHSDTGLINYSFVTGESSPLEINKSDKIYSGGRSVGGSMVVRATKEFNQSYMTKLWNDDSFKKQSENIVSKLSSVTAKYFSIVIIIIAVLSLLFWLPESTSKAFDAFTAVLIIACPCALALTLPFTYGTTMRIFGKRDYFIRNDTVVELMNEADTIVFDKTGTLTKVEEGKVEYIGKNYKDYEGIIKSAVRSSTHPISKTILTAVKDSDELKLNEFHEYPGKGIEAIVDSINLRIGSPDWLYNKNDKKLENIPLENSAILKINDEIYGAFINRSNFREGIFEVLDILNNEGFEISIISGDTERDRKEIEENLRSDISMLFKKLPHEKLKYIEELKKSGKNVIMIGDGLNDAGALAKADLGIAVTEETNNFTPGSDSIILGSKLKELPKLFKLSKSALKIVYASYLISFLYNIIGISFAAQALLSPLIAAILMPLSSISVIAFTVFSVKISAKKLRL